MPLADWFILALLAAIFVGIWGTALLLISIFGGWNELARYYRCHAKYRGKRKWFQTLSVSSGVYRSCAIVGAGAGGLYVATTWPFRFAHPPLLIPWSDISIEWKTTYFFNVRYLVIRARLATDQPISMQDKSLVKLIVESASRYGQPAE